jgi:hypothetical protein
MPWDLFHRLGKAEWIRSRDRMENNHDFLSHVSSVFAYVCASLLGIDNLVVVCYKVR